MTRRNFPDWVAQRRGLSRLSATQLLTFVHDLCISPLYLFPLATSTPMRTGRRTRSQGTTQSLQRVLNSRVGLDYHCKDCGQWLSTYHNAHKRHFSTCKRRLKEAKVIARRIEEHRIRLKYQSQVPHLTHHDIEPTAGGDSRTTFISEDGICLCLACVEVCCSNELEKVTDQSPGPGTLLSPKTSMTPTLDNFVQPPPLDEVEGSDITAQSATSLPLPPGKTLIVYHPHSGLSPKTIDTNSPDHPSSSNVALDGFSDSVDDPPFWPFRTLGDFEQTEFFVTNNFSNRQIDEQLQLLTDHTKPRYRGGGITLSNSREMHKLLCQAAEGFDQPEVGVYDYQRVYFLTTASSSGARKSQCLMYIVVLLRIAPTPSGFDQRLMPSSRF